MNIFIVYSTQPNSKNKKKIQIQSDYSYSYTDSEPKLRRKKNGIETESCPKQYPIRLCTTFKSIFHHYLHEWANIYVRSYAWYAGMCWAKWARMEIGVCCIELCHKMTTIIDAKPLKFQQLGSALCACERSVIVYAVCAIHDMDTPTRHDARHTYRGYPSIYSTIWVTYLLRMRLY